jgi:small subunit ribosomal protein S8
MSDPIADMLTRIRNACANKLPGVSMPGSKMKAAIAEVLKQAGYIQDYRVEETPTKTTVLTVDLKYKGKASTPVIEGIRRISKPSCRIYVGSDSVPRVLGGLGIAILSTSYGVMGDRAARKRNIGGEVLCYVW